MRNLVTRILQKAGYEVIIAECARSAREILASREIDLLLCDVKLPDVVGFELLKEVKLNYPNVAVVMMTAHADSYTIKDALLCGADEYITKPFKHYEVTVVVERAYWRLLASRNQTESL
jgi:DNA-binding NtrC family response regulator